MATVLAVDDSRLARKVILGLLGRLRPGWSLIEAGSAEEALLVLREHDVDVVLIDINMPGADGFSLAERIRELRPGLAIAFVSANIQDAVAARARAMGAAFLTKPLTEQALAPFLEDVAPPSSGGPARPGNADAAGAPG